MGVLICGDPEAEIVLDGEYTGCAVYEYMPSTEPLRVQCDAGVAEWSEFRTWPIEVGDCLIPVPEPSYDTVGVYFFLFLGLFLLLKQQGSK